MKKILFTLFAALACCSFTFAQETFSIDTTSVDTSTVGMQEMMDMMFTNDINIEIDTVLFPIHQASFYMTDATPNPVAVIMTMIVPQPYEEVVKGFTDNLGKGMEMTISKNETLQINNKIATYISGTAIDEGKKTRTEIYFIKENETQTMMITGSMEESVSAKYLNSVKKAAYSAKIDNK